MIGSCIIDMRSGERSDASIAVLSTRIAISPYRHMIMMTVLFVDDDNELACGGLEIRRLHPGAERSVKGFY